MTFSFIKHQGETRGWFGAANLLVGDRVLKSDGQAFTVIANTDDTRPEGVLVFNFAVEDNHTYFVEDGAGEDDWAWVHNMCGPISHLEVRRYGDFKATINKGDDLAGHEILQAAWLRARGISNTPNPSLALTHAEHYLVTAAQRINGIDKAASSLSRVKVIRTNIKLLRSLDLAPEAKLQELRAAVLTFARSLS